MNLLLGEIPSIYEKLKEGGLFVNIDTVQPPSGKCEQRAFNLWRDWMYQKQTELHAKEPDKYAVLFAVFGGTKQVRFAV